MLSVLILGNVLCISEKTMDVIVLVLSYIGEWMVILVCLRDVKMGILPL